MSVPEMSVLLGIPRPHDMPVSLEWNLLDSFPLQRTSLAGRVLRTLHGEGRWGSGDVSRVLGVGFHWNACSPCLLPWTLSLLFRE